MRVYIAGKLNDQAVGYIKNMHVMMLHAEIVRQDGHSVYIPCLDILMGMMCGNYGYEDYFQNSQPWLDVANAVYVCPGSETSSGTQREVERAKARGIPVVYSIEELRKLCPTAGSLELPTEGWYD